MRPTTPGTGPLSLMSSMRWPTRICGSQPPTPMKRKKPLSSMCVTMRPISSMWPTIARNGASGSVPATRATTEPMTSVATSSVKARPASAKTAAGAVS